MSRLVLFARKLDQGGTERQLVALAKALKKRGHDVHVVLFYVGGVFDAELVAEGVPVHFVGKHGRWDIIGFLIRLVLILRRLRPKTIYSFLDLPNILAALLCHTAGRPRLVWSIRSAGMEMRHYDWLSRVVSHLEARLSRAADAVVANSHAGAAWAVSRGFPASYIVVIENGIDTVRFQFDAEGRKRLRCEWQIGAGETAVGLVARLDPMKDHATFLHAVAQLAEVRADLRFICVGGGAEDFAHRLRELAESLGLGKRVVWAGPISDMTAAYSALDIACSSSSFGEGFSNSVAEAMACERPCVVTDVGDSALIVGEVGEVVCPSDANVLAEAIVRMLDRIETRADIRYQARTRIVGEFSMERMVLRTEQVLRGQH